MIPLAKTSILKPRLLLSDLPHVEEFIRNPGSGTLVGIESGRITLADENVKVTRWQLIKAVWGGQGMTIFISELLHRFQALCHRLIPPSRDSWHLGVARLVTEDVDLWPRSQSNVALALVYQESLISLLISMQQ